MAKSTNRIEFWSWCRGPLYVTVRIVPSRCGRISCHTRCQWTSAI